MEFSAKDLEDIQRVAGLLNLTVDELIQQRRRSSGHGTGPNFTTDPIHARHQVAHSGAIHIHQPFQDVSLEDESLIWQHPSSRPQHHTHGSLDPELLGSHPDFQELGPASPTIATQAGTQVILLNPHPAWYDCNAGLGVGPFDGPTEDAFDFDFGDTPPEADEEDASYVPVDHMQLDSENGSEFAADGKGKEKDLDDSGTDWAIMSSPGSLSSFQIIMSPTTNTAEKQRYQYIAPKGRTTRLSSDASSVKVRKKRSSYHGVKKADTNLTRSMHACVRCRMQRNRCIPDPTNPAGPCLTCQRKTVRISRLPCLRYLITDSTLFRTDLKYMDFYRSHPMIGSRYGDFYMSREWTGTPSKTLCLGQLGAIHFKVELGEFVPPVDSSDVDLKGRPMYAVPWAIPDPDAVVVAINDYIDRASTQYLEEYLDDTDLLVWETFEAAYRASIFPTPNRMLQKTLRLWVACRFIESKWRCWAAGGGTDSAILAANPRDPFYDWDSLPPYLDYQIASIVIHRILEPLRKEVLRELQATFNNHNPDTWFVAFLTSFILLKNYEMQMLFQRQFAARRKEKVQYLDMELVRATNSGAKTILAHFHYCYRGQRLFSEGFDWDSAGVRKMARLDQEQLAFMAQCRDNVVKKAPIFDAVNHSDAYHEQYWYTSQLFDADWTPRETLEHAPPAEEVA